jgi:hypothetical protein
MSRDLIKMIIALVLIFTLINCQVDISATPSDSNRTTHPTSNATRFPMANTTNPFEPGLLPPSLKPIDEVFNITYSNLTNATVIIIPQSPDLNQTQNKTTDLSVFELIPRSFFVDRNGDKTSQDYFVFKTNYSQYLGCRQDGSLGLSNSIKKDELWVPSKINITEFPRTIVFRSLSGGLLGLKRDSKFDCRDKLVQPKNYFQPISANRSTGFLGADNNETLKIAFKSNNTGYLGYINNEILLIPEFNQSVVFFPSS